MCQPSLSQVFLARLGQVLWEVLWVVLWYSPKIFTTAYRSRYLRAGLDWANQSTKSQHRPYVGWCESVIQSPVAVAPEFLTSLIFRKVGSVGGSVGGSVRGSVRGSERLRVGRTF